jgi:hypothetical protein
MDTAHNGQTESVPELQMQKMGQGEIKTTPAPAGKPQTRRVE